MLTCRLILVPRIAALVFLITLVLGCVETTHAQYVRSQLDGPALAPVPATTFATEAARWAAFSENIKVALASDHDGTETGALQQIIRYGDRLELDREDVFAIVRIYRSHPNDRARRMAVVALGATQDAWGLDFLKRSVRFEQTPAVKQTILAVLAAQTPPEPALQVAEH